MGFLQTNYSFSRSLLFNIVENLSSFQIILYSMHIKWYHFKLDVAHVDIFAAFPMSLIWGEFTINISPENTSLLWRSPNQEIMRSTALFRGLICTFKTRSTQIMIQFDVPLPNPQHLKFYTVLHLFLGRNLSDLYAEVARQLQDISTWTKHWFRALHKNYLRTTFSGIPHTLEGAKAICSWYHSRIAKTASPGDLPLIFTTLLQLWYSLIFFYLFIQSK